MMDARPRIVIDTNAWLDLLLFDDPRVAALRNALRHGAVCAVVNEACRDEWLRVLRYPQLRLDGARRQALGDAFDGLVQHLEPGADQREPVVLPRCRDRDDRKFVQLAYDARARWLVSRDLDVLALGRRTARAGWFDIITPQAWSLACSDSATAAGGEAQISKR